MRRSFAFLLIAAGAFCQAALPLYPENLPPRRIEIGQKTRVAITAKSVIVIDAKASKVTRFAAKELQSILSQVLGAKLPVKHELPAAGIAYWTLNKKLKPFKRYRLSCVVKLENIKINNRFGGVVLNLADPVNRWFPPQNLLKGSCGWQRMSFEFDGRDLPLGKNAIFNLRIINATGTAWFDDVKIEEIN